MDDSYLQDFKINNNASYCTVARLVERILQGRFYPATDLLDYRHRRLSLTEFDFCRLDLYAITMQSKNLGYSLAIEIQELV